MNLLLKDFKFAEQKESVINIDAVMTCGDLTQKFRDEIDLLPYNDSNFETPVFCLKNVNVMAYNPGKDHVKYLFSDDTGIVETIEWPNGINLSDTIIKTDGTYVTRFSFETSVGTNRMPIK